MHFFLRLIQLYPFTILTQNNNYVPPGFNRVITIRGGFVVTHRNTNVIAK